MTKSKFCAFALSILISPQLHAQSRWPKPDPTGWKERTLAGCDGSEKPLIHQVGKYKIKLASHPDDDSSFGEACSAYLIKPDATESLLHTDAKIFILKGTGEDIFGNGNPGLILEGFSGGAHCCFTYVFADLGDPSTALEAIENQVEFYVFKDPNDQRYKILTWDGGFDYFDDFCHACTPVPRVVLELHLSGLRDVSAEFTADYDEDIARAKAEIKPDELKKFVADPNSSKGSEAWEQSEDVRRAVLLIVFDYLYSGREQEAWRTLDQMWPTGDRPRMKKLIIDTRSQGILSQINAPAHDSTSAAP